MEEDRMELPAYRGGLGYSEPMEVHLAPELQAKIDQWVMETGLPAERLIEDALAGYVPALAQMREMLDQAPKN